MGYMTWIRTWEPVPRWEPWPDWDFMAERSTGLEPHRQPEPLATLRRDHSHGGSSGSPSLPAFCHGARGVAWIKMLSRTARLQGGLVKVCSGYPTTAGVTVLRLKRQSPERPSGARGWFAT